MARWCSTSKNPSKSSVEVTLPLANLDTHVSARRRT
jgi:hypothetical protein